MPGRRGGGSSAFGDFQRAARDGARLRRRRLEQENRPRSKWTPRGSENPDVGVIEGTSRVVSFKTGGPNGDETLIADGDFSEGDGTGAKEARDAFDGQRGDPHHDHYGSAKEGGWIDRVRGYFTE